MYERSQEYMYANNPALQFDTSHALPWLVHQYQMIKHAQILAAAPPVILKIITKFFCRRTSIDGSDAGAKRGVLSLDALAEDVSSRSWRWQTVMVYLSRQGLRVGGAMSRNWPR